MHLEICGNVLNNILSVLKTRCILKIICLCFNYLHSTVLGLLKCAEDLVYGWVSLTDCVHPGVNVDTADTPNYIAKHFIC